MGGLGTRNHHSFSSPHQIPSKISHKTRSQKPSRTAERDEVADRMTFAGVTVYTAALLGCMLLNVSTKGSIGAFETMGISFAESHFGLEPALAGLIVSINGMIGVSALLSMGWLGRFFTDVQMILGGIMVCALGIISFAPLDAVEDGGSNSILHYTLGIFMIYGIGYPIGHTAVIGLFSKGESVVSSRVQENFTASSS
jgi:ceroid-lipofuscinosis MFS transporter 7